MPKNEETVTERLRSVGWILLLFAVFIWFFHDCIFFGYTLIPTDVLHQLVEPYSEPVLHPVVHNHYTMDTIEQDYPWAEFWQKSVREWKVPLWNPAVYGGQPHVATSMAAVFSPFKLLLLWLNVERAWSLGIVLQFMLASVLMFAYLRELGRSGCASFVGACAFALNTSTVMWYWRQAAVFAWVPLVLLLFERSTRKESWGYACSSGFVLGLAFLGGNVQSAAHVAFLCSVYWMLIVPWNDGTRRNRAVLRITLALFIGVCVAAPQWLPTLELMKHDVSGRVQSAGPRPSIIHTLLGIPFCITFVFNGLLGSTESYDLTKLVHATMQDFTGYVGIIPFTLFLVGATDFRERRVRAWLIVGVLVFAVIFFSPFLPYVYHRFFMVAIFGLTVVLAYGADIVLYKSREHFTRIRRVFFGMTTACMLLGLILILIQLFVHYRRTELLEAGRHYIASHAESTVFNEKRQWLDDRLSVFLDHYRITNSVFWLPIGLVIAGGIAWQAFAQGRLGRGVFCAMLVFMTVSDLVATGQRIVPQLSLQEFSLYPKIPVLEKAQDDPDLFRIQRWPLRLPGFLPDNMLMAHHLSTASGYESLAPANFAEFLAVTNAEESALLDLANVKYLLARHTVELPPERFELVADSTTLRLYRNKHCLPRAQFVSTWQVVPDQASALTMMKSSDFDPRKTVFLEQDPPKGFVPAQINEVDESSAVVQIERYEDQRVAIHVRSDGRSGVLLLADTFYSGWGASLDGRETRIYRADGVLRGVFVPAGEHEIEFEYRPLSFRVGTALAVSTTLVLGLWGLARLLLSKWVPRETGLPLL